MAMLCSRADAREDRAVSLREEDAPQPQYQFAGLSEATEIEGKYQAVADE